MVFVEPDYFSQFHCIAGKCKHSCCIGWEIDIDCNSLRRFMNVSGKLGDKLKTSISCKNEPHFILDKDERCPFLNSDGLCELILSEGEEMLCEICVEHPRFYNEFDGRCEAGLGMCCEEAARLLLSGETAVELVVYEDKSYANSPCPPIVIERDNILSRLADSTKSLSQRLMELSSYCPSPLSGFAPLITAQFYLSLEQMDKHWAELLNDMAERGAKLFQLEKLDEMRYERIMEYLVYRHYALANDAADAALRLAFCILSTEIICCLEQLGYRDDALRLYSAEIEYSDENIRYILQALNSGILHI